MTDLTEEAPSPPGPPEPERAAGDRLSRRTATTVVAAVLLLALVAVATLLPAPYAVERPGPTEDTLGAVDGTPVLRIEGRRTYATDGALRLTTVTYTSCGTSLSVWSGLRAWLQPTDEVVPRELVCPVGATPQQVDEQNAELMSRSQESAKVAALRQVGVRVPQAVVVAAVTAGAPAQGRLRAGDTIVSVDGTPVATPEQVRDLVRAREPGQDVAFVVRREVSGRQADVRVVVRTGRAEVDGEAVPVVGIEPAVGYDFPFPIDVTLGEDIGGPSAGLMFALGIVDKLTPGQLTGGRDVAGTGEMAADGTVGPIGGIQQKAYGAQAAGATVFLAPTANCPDLTGVDVPGLQIVEVETLDGAVRALRAIDAGQPAPSCG